MKPLFFWINVFGSSLFLAKAWAQTSPIHQRASLVTSAQVRSLRQFYWVRELPPHDENPGNGCLGYFGSEAQVTLIWRAGQGAKPRIHCLGPNSWQNQPLEAVLDTGRKREMPYTIQLEIE